MQGNLRNGNTQSCGCIKIGRPHDDLTGQIFHYLTALEVHSHDPVKWLCRCKCGKIKTIAASALVSGETISCGCYKSERMADMNITNNPSEKKYEGITNYTKVYDIPEYRVWQAMKTRCSNENINSYDRYGGRGIKVCDRWLNSFENFYRDMGSRPGESYSIDRINNDGNYEPGNCRWATAAEQVRNTCTQDKPLNGVYENRYGSWVATIGVDGKRIQLGTHKKIEDAIRARKSAEKKYWGR